MSGGARRRPGLDRALDLLASGQARTLVVAKMDRLARSVLHASDILEAATRQGWEVHVLDIGMSLATPHGRAMAQMLSVFAELEKAMIGQRTKDALAAARNRGVRLGRPVTLPDDVRQRVALLAGNGKSHAAIARELNAANVPTVSGAPWHRATV